MKFGIQHPNFTYDGQGTQLTDSLRSQVLKAEETGYDSFWVMDHFHQISMVGKPEEPMLEGWVTISVLAGMTSKIKLGTLVTGNVYRYPSVLAKMGATLDVLSKGRLFLGIGAAWNEEEAEAYGIPFPPTRERMARLDEALQIIRAMWTEDRANFDGKYYKLKGAMCNPKPIQKPAPKILIGGTGEKFLLKIVAKYGDACNFFGSAETVRKKLAILREHCKSVGRDYDSILKTKLTQLIISEDEKAVNQIVGRISQRISNERLKEAVMYGTPDQLQNQIEELREAGIQYLIMSFMPGTEMKSIPLFAEKVMPKFQ
jgi:F420-dependent oxidoreductase-like protein